MSSIGIRETDLTVASHRRLVYRNIVGALQAAFDDNYNRDRQLENLRITPTFPIKKIDYPSVVVQYQNAFVANAGVAHVEWFPDPLGRLRQWNHSRFEGTINLTAFALSPLDRDILVDALVEVIRFGRLDEQLNRFYQLVYPEHTPPAPPVDPTDPWPAYNVSLFNQLMLNSDRVSGIGDSVSVAPWQPEDVMVYSGGVSTDLHGAYYNTYPSIDVDWRHITSVVIDAYQTGQYGNELPFPGHAEIAWDPPFVFTDTDVISGGSEVSGEESHFPGELVAQETVDAAAVHGVGAVSSDEEFEDV